MSHRFSFRFPGKISNRASAPKKMHLYPLPAMIPVFWIVLRSHPLLFLLSNSSHLWEIFERNTVERIGYNTVSYFNTHDAALS